MKQKIPQPAFGENKDKPFEGDLLNREQEIKDLTPMITKIASPATMALDAEWGAGKTAFIKMWKAHLNNAASARAFYFNAWKTDFAADPLAPFMAAIAKQLPEPDDSTELVEKAKKLIPVLVGDVVRKFVGSGTAQVAENALEHLLVHNDKTTEFKTALKDFAAAQKGKRVVIFVDELDRCRPDYAVKVLERIKHLFEVPGLVFVLATNRKQLCHSVKALYGAEFDADEYLRRFIEFDYTIKAPADIGVFISARLKGLEIDKFLAGRKNRAAGEMLHKTLALLAKLYGSNPRDVEQLLMRVVLVLWSLEYNAKYAYPFYPALLAFLVVARLKARDNYAQYIIPANNWEEMVAYWHDQLKPVGILEARGEWKDISIAAYITAHIICAKGLSPKNDTIRSYEEKANKGGYYHALMQYIDNFANDDRRDKGIDLSILVRKIEMLDQLRFTDDAVESNGNGN